MDQAAARVGHAGAKAILPSEKISMTVPFNQLSKSDQQADHRGPWRLERVRGFFDWMETKKYKLHVRVFPFEVSWLHVVS
jgi:hypothetical protein